MTAPSPAPVLAVPTSTPDATGSPLIDSSGTVVGIVTRRGASTGAPDRDASGTELEVRYATTIEWAKRVPFVDGEIEIRPVFELSDFPASPAVDRAAALGKQLGK